MGGRGSVRTLQGKTKLEGGGMLILFTLLWAVVGCQTSSEITAYRSTTPPLKVPERIETADDIRIYHPLDSGPARDYPHVRGVHDAIFYPDSRHLVVVYARDGNQHLYRVAIDGSSWMPLTWGDRVDFDPVFSPDGSKILFSSKVKRDQVNLFIMDGNGANRRSLTQWSSIDFHGRFSSDGHRIVFSSAREGQDADIYLIDTDGAGLLQLTDGPDHDTHPLMLRDDGAVLFARERFVSRETPQRRSREPSVTLYTVKTNLDAFSRVARRMLTNIAVDVAVPRTKTAFSALRQLRLVPGGAWAMAETEEGWYQITLINDRQWYDVRRVSTLSLDYGDVDFWRDSNRFTFMMIEGDASGIALPEVHMGRLSSGEKWRLTSLEQVIDVKVEEARNPRLSPDGSKIIFRVLSSENAGSPQSDLWIMNADGTDLVPIPVPPEVVAGLSD